MAARALPPAVDLLAWPTIRAAKLRVDAARLARVEAERRARFAPPI